MPELPEVETVRRGLAPALVGARFARVEQRRPDLRFPLPEKFAARLEGAKVEDLGRRAKYLLAQLDTDAENRLDNVTSITSAHDNLQADSQGRRSFTSSVRETFGSL